MSLKPSENVIGSDNTAQILRGYVGKGSAVYAGLSQLWNLKNLKKYAPGIYLLMNGITLPARASPVCERPRSGSQDTGCMMLYVHLLVEFRSFHSGEV